MSFQEVTVQENGSGHLTSQATLDGVSFGLNFYLTKVPDLQTGAVAEFWYMDELDSAAVPLVLGIGLVTGIDILFPYRARAMPKGKLFVNPEGTRFIDPTANTFKDDEAFLFYQPEADVLALGLAGDSS